MMANKLSVKGIGFFGIVVALLFLSYGMMFFLTGIKFPSFRDFIFVFASSSSLFSVVVFLISLGFYFKKRWARVAMIGLLSFVSGVMFFGFAVTVLLGCDQVFVQEIVSIWTWVGAAIYFLFGYLFWNLTRVLRSDRIYAEFHGHDIELRNPSRTR